MAPILVSHEFGYVALASAAVSLQCVLSATAVSKLRKKHNVHYPDSGDGRHAAKLTEAEWEEFHNAQRAHRNYTEQVGVTQALLITGGLLNPRPAVYTAIVYILGRHMYYYGYVKDGPSGRVSGARILHLSLVAMLGNSVYSGLKLLGYV